MRKILLPILLITSLFAREYIAIIEALLNSAGIEYFSLNENVTNLYGGLNILSRGIEIQVAEENVEKANELINSEPRLTNHP